MNEATKVLTDAYLKKMRSLSYGIFNTLKGRVVLYKIYMPPLLSLEGWPTSNI